MLNIRLRSCSGSYVSAEGGGGREVLVNRAQAYGWETFRVVDVNAGAVESGDQIALVAYDGHFVCAEGGGGREIVANRDAIGEWEKFTLVDMSGAGFKDGGKIALRSHNGNYVCAEGGGGRELLANRSAAYGWETFTIEVAIEERVLVVLQENSGKIPIPDIIGEPLRGAIFRVVDQFTEFVQDVKARWQGAGKYHQIELLTDQDCTRQRLLDALVRHSTQGRTIDLLVLAHGANNSISLHGEKLTGESIRSLLTDARARGCDRLRLWTVFSCSCYGSTLNGAWRDIGCKIAIGSRRNDWMPEPMTTFFMHRWLGGQTPREAAESAYRDSIPYYLPLYPPSIEVRTRKEIFTYPCGVEVDPKKPWRSKVKWCTAERDVPDGLDVKENSKFADTQPIIDGCGDLRF